MCLSFDTAPFIITKQILGDKICLIYSCDTSYEVSVTRH